MKLLKRGLCGLLAVVLMVPGGAGGAGKRREKSARIWRGWAQKEVEAMQLHLEGWCGYPTGASSQGEELTRAEFTKMRWTRST